MAEFETLLRTLTNWGQWGPEDEKGTLNYITPAIRRRAAGMVRQGKTFSLAIPIRHGSGPQAGGARIDFGAWFENIGNVKAEGEFGHFKFFHSLYEGAHPLIREIPGVWDLPATDERHPCYAVPVNPTAYEGRPNTIKDPDLRALAWLGNLNYWCLLLLLDAGYQRNSRPELALAQAIMMGPLWSIARYLPTKINGRLPAAGTRMPLRTPQFAPTGIEPDSDSKSRRIDLM